MHATHTTARKVATDVTRRLEDWTAATGRPVPAAAIEERDSWARLAEIEELAAEEDLDSEPCFYCSAPADPDNGSPVPACVDHAGSCDHQREERTYFLLEEADL